MTLLELLLHLFGFPDITHLFARIWGVLCIALFSGLLVNRSCYMSILSSLDKQFVILAGMLMLVGGALSMIFHDVWEYSWIGLITLFGWLIFFSGMIMTMFPQAVAYAVKKVAPALYYMAVIFVALGAYLVYKGLEDTWTVIPEKIPQEISTLEEPWRAP